MVGAAMYVERSRHAPYGSLSGHCILCGDYGNYQGTDAHEALRKVAQQYGCSLEQARSFAGGLDIRDEPPGRLLPLKDPRPSDFLKEHLYRNFTDSYDARYEGPDRLVCPRCLPTLLVCPTCRGPKTEEQPECPACLRAVMVAGRSEAAMTAALASVTHALDDLRGDVTRRLETLMAKPQELAPPVQTTTTLPELPPPPTMTETLGEEVQDGLWQGGIEALADEIRDLVASLMVSDLPKKQQGHAKEVVMACLKGSWGTPMVAALGGSGLLLLSTKGIQVPFIPPAITARVGREFRVLAVRSVTRKMIGQFVTPFASHLATLAKSISGLGSLGTLSDLAEPPAPSTPAV